MDTFTQFVEFANKNNYYFLLKQDGSARYMTNNKLMNNIASEIIYDISNNNESQSTLIKSKYMNTYAKLYKLEEAIDAFDFGFGNSDLFQKTNDYIRFLKKLLCFLIDNTKEQVPPHINACIGCGVDMGESNPRQYCRKTHCPYEKNDN